MSWEEPLGLSASSFSTGGTTHSPPVEDVCICVSRSEVSLQQLQAQQLILLVLSIFRLLHWFVTLLIAPFPTVYLCQLFLPELRSGLCSSSAQRSHCHWCSPSVWIVIQLSGSVAMWRLYCCTVMPWSSINTVSKGDWALSVCVAWCNHFSHLPLSSPSFLSSFPPPLHLLHKSAALFEGNQAALTNYAALAVPPRFFPSSSPPLSTWPLSNPFFFSPLILCLPLFSQHISRSWQLLENQIICRAPSPMASATASLLSLAATWERQTARNTYTTSPFQGRRWKFHNTKM